MISNFFNIKFIVNIGIFVVILGTIIYLSYDVFNLTLIKIFPEEYAINECPNGKKIRIKPSTELPVEFNNMMYEVGFVTDVTDGDTIELGDCRRIRYLGIDTPETLHPEKPIECYGPESSNFNKQLVLNKKVLLFKGNKDKDSFGRYLRYVVLAENSIFVNQYLVENGLAKLYTKYIEDNIEPVYEKLQESELEAKQNSIGRWEKCGS
tara:strand:- start:216 stop:839 length:624 start_codon:yes stop_codon:yes gene_type:complete